MKPIRANPEQKKEGDGGMDPALWSQSLSSKLLEIVKTGIVLTDIEGHIRFANNLAGEMLGYSKDFLKGKSIKMFFLPEDTAIYLPNIMRLTLEGAGFEGEALLRRNDGSTFFVNLSTVLYKGDSPEYELMVFTFQDITHLKKLEKEYISSERFAGLGVMTDQISHQIRNPIVSIGGFALRLAKDQISHEEFEHYTGIIHSEAKRLELIIDRLVEFAQIHPAHYSAMTLAEVFEGVKKALRHQIEANILEIAFYESEWMYSEPIFGDLTRIIRAVQCLVQNALEALPENNGKVTISGNIIGNQVMILVKDNGDGILPENLPFIFDPFFTTKFKSLGLGLTLAKRIIQEHKGGIEVNTSNKEENEVSIILPRERRREIRTKLL
ncbi:MAG: PAS domain S-box protein [Proteobacteria bacterium]|nr:PAS domain S-box protein [Pseudomonadota bacterium]